MPETTHDTMPAKARTYAGVPKEERTRLRRERLIESATEVFGRLGYAQVTMRDICANARLAERYFYESFDSTKGIFEAVCQIEVQRLITVVSDAIMQAPLTDRRFIEAGVRAFLNFIREDPRRVQIILIDGVWMDQLQAREGDSELLLGYTRVIRHLTRGFHPDISAEINVDMAASGLVAMAIHTAIGWARSNFAADIDSVLKHNLYAWAGLRHWIKVTHAVDTARVSDSERRAWVQTAFKAKDDWAV